MIAVDTNIIVRLLTGDDPVQEDAARRLFTSGEIWIAKTVLLETGWVLRRLYGFDDKAICEAFIKMLGLRNVQVEDEASIAAALALTSGGGVEFADAIHLCSMPKGVTFVSFDKAFVKRAQRAGITDISDASIKNKY